MLLVLNKRELTYLREIMSQGVDLCHKDENLLSLYDKVGELYDERKYLKERVEKMVFVYSVRLEDTGEKYLGVSEKLLYKSERGSFPHPKWGNCYAEITYRYDNKITREKAKEIDIPYFREIEEI